MRPMRQRIGNAGPFYFTWARGRSSTELVLPTSWALLQAFVPVKTTAERSQWARVPLGTWVRTPGLVSRLRAVRGARPFHLTLGAFTGTALKHTELHTRGGWGGRGGFVYPLM